jgi:hypothetical protein
MPLLGKGVAAIWHDIDAAHEADYHHWHCHEHIPERVSIPGFLRGRRFAPVSGAPRFFHFYETESVETLTSAAYLERLNDPTPWTQRVVPNFRNNNRTLAQVAGSFGEGVGTAMLTIQCGPAPGKADALQASLLAAMPGWVQEEGVIGAHLLRGDQDASNVQTEEKAMRGRADDVADWVIMVEGLETSYLEKLRAGALSENTLTEAGAQTMNAGLYRLHFVLHRDDFIPATTA